MSTIPISLTSPPHLPNPMSVMPTQFRTSIAKLAGSAAIPSVPRPEPTPPGLKKRSASMNNTESQKASRLQKKRTKSDNVLSRTRNHYATTNEPTLPAMLSRERRLSVRVPRASLHNTRDGALPRQGSRRNSLLFTLKKKRKKKVNVEPAHANGDDYDGGGGGGGIAAVGDTTLYVPFGTGNYGSPVPTQFVSQLQLYQHDATLDDLVFKQHDFEISLVGVHVDQHDVTPISNASSATSATNTGNHQQGNANMNNYDNFLDIDQQQHHYNYHHQQHHQHKQPQRHLSRFLRRKSQQQQQTSCIVYSNSNSASTSATIHFDSPALPMDSFIPAPASKALVYRHRHKLDADVVPLKLAAMQTDGLTASPYATAHKYNKRSVDVLNALARNLSGGADLPGVVADAVLAAANVGKKGLKKVAKRAEYIVAKDLEFRLADEKDFIINSDPQQQPDSPLHPQHPRHPRHQQHVKPMNTKQRQQSTHHHHHNSSYLRYGYYFFLKQNMDAKLYAQTEASVQAVPLLMRRSGYTRRMADRGETEYFPLTGMSYVVVRVTPGTSGDSNNASSNKSSSTYSNGKPSCDERDAARIHHLQQIQQLLRAFAELK